MNTENTKTEKDKVKGPLRPITVPLLTPVELPKRGLLTEVTVRPARVRDVLLAQERSKGKSQLAASAETLAQLCDLAPDELLELTCIDFELVESAAAVFFPQGWLTAT